MKKLFYESVLTALVPFHHCGQEISLKGKELFGGLQALLIGPALMSGRIIDVENHPTNARIIKYQRWQTTGKNKYTRPRKDTGIF